VASIAQANPSREKQGDGRNDGSDLAYKNPGASRAIKSGLLRQKSASPKTSGDDSPENQGDGSPEKLGDDRNDSECRHCEGAVCATEAIRLILTRAIYLPKYKRSIIPMLIALSGKIRPPRNDAFYREASSSPGYQGDGSPEHQGGFRNGIKFKKTFVNL